MTGNNVFQVDFLIWTSLFPRLGRPASHLTLIFLPTIVATQTVGTGLGKWNQIRFWNCVLTMILSKNVSWMPVGLDALWRIYQVLCTSSAHAHYKGIILQLGILSKSELHQRYVIPNRWMGSQFITKLHGGESLGTPNLYKVIYKRPLMWIFGVLQCMYDVCIFIPDFSKHLDRN